MPEDKKNKKTLTLKLGSKRNFAPVNSFETGKTVIVEKNGEEVQRFVGVQSELAYVNAINEAKN